MPSKKRKYEARFPPARIKKIMQTDEEIGKVAAAVPIIISRSLEIFLQSLVETTASYTNQRKAKTMTTLHLKHCIENEKKFDFLKDLVANIAEIANAEEDDTTGEIADKPKRTRKRASTGEARKKRKKASSSDNDEEETDPTSDTEDQKPQKQQMPQQMQNIQPQLLHLPPPLQTPKRLSSSTSPSPPLPGLTCVPSFQRTSNHSIEAIMSRPHTPQPQQQPTVVQNLQQPQHKPTAVQNVPQSEQLPTVVPNTSTIESQPQQPNVIQNTLPVGLMMRSSISNALTNDDEDDDYDT